MFLPELSMRGFGGLEPSLCVFWKGPLAPSGPGRILALTTPGVPTYTSPPASASSGGPLLSAAKVKSTPGLLLKGCVQSSAVIDAPPDTHAKGLNVNLSFHYGFAACFLIFP